MRKFLSCSMVVLATCLTAASPLTAQVKSGPGGVLDWIQRLSGPSMLGPAASYSWEFGEEGPRLRFEGALRFPVARRDRIGEDQELNMFSIQPSIEWPILGSPFEVKTGIDFHRFGGTGHKTVWHISFPLYGQLRFAVDEGDSLFLRFAAGIHYFPAFGYHDFDREIVVNTGSGEGSLAILVGLDFMR